MRTPRRRAVEILFLLLLVLPSSGYASLTILRSPKSGPPGGLTVTVAGVVVDERERPVANAEVEMTVPDPSWDLQRQRTRTDAGGHFLLPTAEEGRPCSLRVSRPGFSPAFLDVFLHGTSEVRLVLRPGVTLSGRLVDEDGLPIPGARIDLFPRQENRGVQDARLYRAASGADGRFEIPDLPEERFDLRVTRHDLLPLVRKDLILPRGPERVDLGRLPLLHGKRLIGRVLDPRGHPLAGVSIWSEIESDPRRVWQGDDVPWPDSMAVTGPDGGFAVPRVSDQVQFFRFCRPGYEESERSLLPKVSAFPPIVLTPTPPLPRVSGRVLDESGKPVPGARVQPGNQSGESRNIILPRPCQPVENTTGAVADAAGRFSLPVPRDSGSFDLRAQAPGYLREVRTAVSAPARSLDIVLSRGATISGRISGPDGDPAPGTRVYAGQDGRAPETLTDARGRYRLTGVRPGTRELWAEHPELGEARRRLQVAPGAHRLDLTLDGQRERAVSGEVTGPGGEPLAGVRVEASDLTTYTRQDGSFRLVFPRGTLLFYEGETPLRFTREGFAPTVQPIRASETPIEGLEVRLARGWPLTGNLLGTEPEQLRYARIEARRNGGEAREGRMNGDGTYRIDDLEPGTWTVTARLGNQTARGAVEIGPGESSLDLKLPSLREVSGRVLDPYGSPVPPAVVIFQNLGGEDGPSPTAACEEDGTFSLQLAEGTYRVLGRDDAWAPATLEATLEKPLTVGVHPIDGLEIRLKSGAVLQGRILGMPAGADAILSATPPFPSVVPWISAGPDGSYRIPALEPGERQVEASVSWDGVRRTGRSRVALAPGETEKTLDLDLSFGPLTLSGRLDSGGEPLSTEVALLAPDGEALTDDLLIEDEENGVFRFPALRPGTYILRIKDYSRDRVVLKPVELTSDQTVTIDLLHP